MLGVGQRVNIEELADRLAHGTEILRPLLLRDEALLLDAEDIDRARNAHHEECELIGDVAGVRQLLAELFEHTAVGKRAERVEQAVDHRQRDGEPAFGVMPVGLVLPGAAQLLVLVGLRDAERDHADAHERHSHERERRQIVADADSDEREHRYDRAGAVADGGGDGELYVPETEIADGHGENVEHRNRQIHENDLPCDADLPDEDLIGSVQTHNDTDGHDHFEMAVFVAAVLTANFGEKIGAAPAEQSDECKPKPHNECLFLSCFYFRTSKYIKPGIYFARAIFAGKNPAFQRKAG